MNPKLDVFETVNSIILEAMNKGIAPWKKPWTCYKDKNGQEYNGPINLVSKKPYRGINALILGCSSFSSPFFLTFKPAKEIGGSIKKDSKSTSVVFWQVGTKDELNADGEIIQKKTFILKYYNVFNIDQTENIKIPADFIISEKPFFQDEMAERKFKPPITLKVAIIFQIAISSIWFQRNILVAPKNIILPIFMKLVTLLAQQIDSIG